MPVRRTAILTAAALVATAAPAAAEPSLTALKPCYVSVRTASNIFDTETVAFSGSGFTPNAFVDIAVGGLPVLTGIAVDGAGNLAVGAVKAPIIKLGEKLFDITATEQGDPGQTASADSRVSELSVRVKPLTARPRQRIRFKGRGFTTPGAPVYAHYALKGKLRKTVRLAAQAEGECGTFSVRRRQFPVTPKIGRWTVQFDQRQAFTDDPPLVQLAIDVKRTPRTRTRR